MADGVRGSTISGQPARWASRPDTPPSATVRSGPRPREPHTSRSTVREARSRTFDRIACGHLDRGVHRVGKERADPLLARRDLRRLTGLDRVEHRERQLAERGHHGRRGQRVATLLRVVERGADAPDGGALVAARRERHGAGRLVQQPLADPAGHDPPERATVRRADHEHRGGERCGRLVQAGHRRARGDDVRDRSDRVRELPHARECAFAPVGVVREHGDPRRRLARRDVRESERRGHEPGQLAAERDRRGVIVAQRDADEDRRLGRLMASRCGPRRPGRRAARRPRRARRSAGTRRRGAARARRSRAPRAPARSRACRR